MDILDLFNKTEDNHSVTENGMEGYKTTYNVMTDMNFKISSYRHLGNYEKARDFANLLNSNDYDYALRFLFYVRDARSGIGERDLFRVWLNTFANDTHHFDNKDEIMRSIVNEWIPQYGRYDDLFVLLDTPYADLVFTFVKTQLKEDYANMLSNKNISLLAKWMPSENTSSPKTVKLAKIFIKKLGTTPAAYRKTLSALREKLNIVEAQLSANEWNTVDYNAVPSKANLKYKNAFLKHDEERRRDYLAKLRVGDTTVKMNGGVNFPHEIVHAYSERGYWRNPVKPFDESLEQLWKNLKDVKGLTNTIVVRDGSGSMTTPIDGTKTTALDVSTALAIYCAERLKGDFNNKFITFSDKAKVINLTADRHSLWSKLKRTYEFDDCSNTNIDNVFYTLLRVAVDFKVKPEDMPANVLIISDMEFDASSKRYGFNAGSNVFEGLKKEYASRGYMLPKLIFWNVASRTNTIPCKQNENGVILVSGFSPNVLRLVMSGKTDPSAALCDELDANYGNIPLLKKISTTSYNKRQKMKTKEIPDFLLD